MSSGEFHLARNDGSRATVSILNGGVITTAGSSGGIRMGYGTGVADVTVDGAGSLLSSSTSIDVGETGRSILTLSNGGRANANSVRVGLGGGASGVVNIGAAVGVAPVAPGILGTASVILNAGLNSLLVLNHTDVSGSYTLGPTPATSPLISGTGQVRAYGGTTVLTRNNTYSGGTAINGGVLQISSNANLGAVAGTLSFDGGTLRTTADILDMPRATTLNAAGGTFETQAGTLTHSGTITGAGALTKTGGGTLLLTADDSYTGGTTIAAGTLQLGNGGNGGPTGAVVGDIANNAALVLNRSNTLALAGTISGTGRVDQRGAGTAILTGNNIYTGGTTITAGTLQLGNGGTTGSIVGDVTNNAALVFNRSDALDVGGLVSGTGSVSQIGAGTTVLTGSNTYQGTTTVAAGALYVNGNQAGAAGLTTVASGATLGGTGSLGGDAVVANGGTFSPGGLGTAPGTLTVNGNLSLGSGSVLAYSFGRPNTAGGAFNDLTNVGGNLTLDGTLNITVSPGGTFDPGVYRVFNYGGALNNQGLTLGSGTSPGQFVQTSVVNQVNLVNAAGLTLNFWDGALGPKNNAAVNGGDGLWQNSSGNDNWTNADGLVNAPFSDGAFAVFMAQPGSVAVDNSLGQVRVSGMQFAADGYRIDGGSIALVGSPSSTVRVGDGTTGGAGYTATIDSVLTGASQLVKADLGTLVLGAANTHTGGTAIDGGVLQVSSDSNLGAPSGALSFDGGTLRTTADITTARATTLNAAGGTFETQTGTLTHNGTIAGAGALVKTGNGTLVLSGANVHAGPTTVAAGTLRAGAANTFSAASAHTVAAGATLDTAGFNQTVASLSNNGTVSLVSAAAGSTLTVTGAYVANSVLRLGTVLAGSAGLSDRLVLDGAGASASGSTTVQIVNLGGLGALTAGNGIEVVSGLNGATTTAQTTRSAFSLANGHVDAGAFEYRLYAADAAGAGENWYLRSTTPVVPPLESVLPGQPMPPSSPPVLVPTYRAEVPLLAGMPAQFRQADLAMLGNLHRRIGDEFSERSVPEGGTRRAWGRAVYSDLDIKQPGVADVQTQGHVSGQQAGTDLLVNGDWRAGVYVGYLDGGADVSGNARGITGRVGSNDLQSRYLGAYATWMQASGFYVDSVLQGGSQRYTVRPDLNPSVSGKASSFAASIETGKPFALSERWSIEPQAQLIYQQVNPKDVTLSGAQVSHDADSGWIGRLGVRIKGDITTGAGRLLPYARLNLYRASIDSDVVTFIGPAGATAIASAGGYSAAEAAAGATLALTSTTSLYGEIGHLWDIGGDATVKSSMQASLGVKVNW